MFALPEFDPNDYANAVLAGETYPIQAGKSRPAKNTSFAPANEDISVAISKLNFSIDDVDKQLKNVVCVHRRVKDKLPLIEHRSLHITKSFSCKRQESLNWKALCLPFEVDCQN